MSGSPTETELEVFRLLLNQRRWWQGFFAAKGGAR